MRTYYIALLSAMMLMFQACSGWLDIQPELELRKEKMYRTEEGFKDVLTGAYIRLAMPSLYGNNLTIGMTELMAQHWITSPNTTADHFRNFEFGQSSVQKVLTEVWLQYYQTAANLNVLLEEIDAKVPIFTNGNYELIKGEALGLRGFIHFEVLRLWGDVPGDMVREEKAIPYIKEISKNPNELRALPYAEVLKYILDDLNAAEKLLKDDPIVHYLNAVLNKKINVTEADRPGDDYHYYRQNRFNYYAVKATKARYYLWLGMKEQALAEAKEVLEAVNTRGGAVFKLGGDEDAAAGDMTFPSEHVFAVNNSQAYSIVKAFFINEGGYTQEKSKLNRVYEETRYPMDIRYYNNRLWEERSSLTSTSGMYNFFMKYVTNKTAAVDIIPVIRLSELCFIAAECGDLSYLSDYRIKRNITKSGSDIPDEDEIHTVLEMEYRKEFYGEGQMFYYYKRNKTTAFTLPSAFTMDPDNYKLPQPQGQLVFE